MGKKILLCFGFLSFFATQANATVYRINCYLADDRNGDETLIRHDDMKFDTESENQQPKYIQHGPSEHDIGLGLSYDDNEGFIYLSIVDQTEGIEASSLTDGSFPVYVNLSTEAVGLFAACQFEHESGEIPSQKKKKKKSKTKRSQAPQPPQKNE